MNDINKGLGEFYATWGEKLKIAVDRSQPVEDRLAALHWIDNTTGSKLTPVTELENVTDAVLRECPHLKPSDYTLSTWEQHDCVYEGLKYKNVLRIYRYCCGLEDMPTTTQLDDQPIDLDEVLSWLGMEAINPDDPRWAYLHSTEGDMMRREEFETDDE